MMADSQKNSLLQHGSSDLNTTNTRIISLEERFAALSNLASPSEQKGKTGTIIDTIEGPIVQSIHPRSAAVDQGQRGFEPSADNHIHPYEGLEIARKGQKGVQSPSGLAHGDGSDHAQDKEPSASLTITLPVDSSSILASVDLTLADAEPMNTSRRRRGTRRNRTTASAFLGHFNVIGPYEGGDKENLKGLFVIEEKAVEALAIEVEGNGRVRDVKVEGAGERQNFHFESEGKASREIQAQANPIKVEVNETSNTPSLGEVLPQEPILVIAVEEIGSTVKIANPIPKPENLKFKRLPDTVLLRYPRMGKYLNALVAQEDSTRRVGTAPIPLVGSETTPTPSIVAQKSIKLEGEEGEGKEKNNIGWGNAGRFIPPKSISGNENGSLHKTKARVEATFTPKISENHGIHFQEGTAQPRRLSPAIDLERPMEDTSEKQLEATVHFPIEGAKLLQSASTRPSLPERYAIPIIAQSNETAVQKITIKAGSIGVATEKNEPRLEKDSLMEQLAMIDERFSRDSGGNLVRSVRGQHKFSFTRRSSMSSEASITFSIAPDAPNHPETGTVLAKKDLQDADSIERTPISVHGTSIGVYDRSRRSMSPSPSPHSGRIVAFPASTGGMLVSDNLISIARAEGSGQQTEDMAGKWLEQFTSSAKPPNVPRAKPSILARMHQASVPMGYISDESSHRGDDGIAPGEWIQPIGLSKKLPSKPKIGITAGPPPPLFQVAHTPLLRSTRGSAAGSAAGSVTESIHRGQRFYAPTAEDGSVVGRGAPEIAQPRKRTDSVSTVRELERATQKEKTVIEWRERGFTEVGRLDEKSQMELNKRLLEEQRQMYGANLLNESQKGGSENSRGRWKAPREGGLFASPPSTIRGVSPSSLTIQARVVSVRGSGPVQHPPARQQQTVDPNVQDIAAILRDIQTTQKAKAKVKMGGFVSPAPNANDSTAGTWKNFSGPSLPVPQAPMAPQVPKAMPKKTEVKQPVAAAHVRNLCPIFLAGPCRLGLSCLDLHPNYDEQSGTYADKRFATKESFSEEALKRAEKEKERQKALEELIKQSRDAADKKCYERLTGKGYDPKAKKKPRALQVAAGVVVQKNAKGEKDWVIYPPKAPTPPPPPPPPPPKRVSDSDSDDFRSAPTKSRFKHCRET